MNGMCGSDDAVGGCGGGTCGGSCSGPYVPELDARVIDPMIRQSAIFGVLMGMPEQGSVRITVNTDPSAIAGLLEERLPGQYTADVTPVSGDEFQVVFTRA